MNFFDRMEFRRDLKATLVRFMQNIAKRASRERGRLASLAQIGELARGLSKICQSQLNPLA